MSTFAKLRLVAAKRQRNLSPLLHRRNKLVSKITEQIELLKAQKEGRTYAPKRLKTYTDRESGQRMTIEATKRVKEWYWPSEAGKINLEIRYGSKALSLNAKGANAIEVSDGDELLSTLEIIKQAAIGGELDAQIEAASKSLKAGFEKH
jgi:hypothetical protein